MNVERTRWFRLVVGVVSLGTVWWLTALVGVWPNGPPSISAAILLLFCLVGAERLYGIFLGIAAIALWRGRDSSARLS
jgi:hypothetical protein